MTPNIHLMVDKYAVIRVNPQPAFNALGEVLFTSAIKDIAIEQSLRYIRQGIPTKVYERMA